MLQIATGRFHKVAAARKHIGYATLFSSGDIYRDLRTPMGTIKRSTATGRLAGHVHEYVQHHTAPGEGVLVWGGDRELNDDLAAAMTLFLPGFFDADQAVVLAATERDPSGHPRDERLPSNFLPSKLRLPLANPTGELGRFESLLDRLVQLPRSDFEVLIEAMRAFKRAILALRLDHLLAYSNLVFCLESLAQNLQPYKAEWEDYPDADRTRIEVSLNGLDIDIQERVKAAIIEDRQLRLTKRFVSFIEERVRPTYYRNEASGIKGAIRPSELENCLKVAYQIRSGYAHSLAKRFKHIQIPMIADGETYTWDGQTVPTFAGLARLLEHVMRTLIMEAVPVEPEEIPFTRLMPGVITMKVAPKHALANYKVYKSGWAQRVLSLVVTHLWFLPAAKPVERKVILVEEFMDDAIAKLGQMNAHEECCALNLVRLYEPYLGTSLKPEWRKLLEASDEKLRKANWPNLVSVILVGGSLDNDGDYALTAADELQRISTKKNGPDIPKDLVLAARTVAVSMIFEDKPDRGRDLNGALVLEAAGRPRAQELIERIDDEYTIPELQRALLGVPEPEQAGRKDEE
ncbi:MAG: hypothetical protein ABIL58_03990 [Pseudomonadota bacterium]